MATKKLYLNPLTKMSDNGAKLYIRLEDSSFEKLKQRTHELQDMCNVPCSQKLISVQKVIATLVDAYANGEIDIALMKISARK